VSPRKEAFWALTKPVKQVSWPFHEVGGTDDVSGVES
jgi:hypothetical protein